MADETEILKVSVDIGDAERNLDQLAAKAEAAANKISAAFANVKMPDISGKVAEHGKKVHEHASGIAATIEGMTERIGGSLKTLGAGFGEGGRLLGEMSEGAVKGIGAIGLALASLGGGAKTAAKEMATIGDSAEEAMARSVKVAERAKGSIGEALKGALMGGPVTLALAGITAAVGGGIGAAFFGGKEAKDLEEMSHAANETYEEFKKIAEAGLEIGIGPEKMAETLKTANNLIREGGLQAREMAESFAVMQDRIQYIKDAIKEQAVARKEAEYSAQDAAEAAQHNIQQAYHGSRQAAQGVVDAQQRYEDALEEYQRHGRPRTASEQRDYEEKHRKLALEAAERGVKEAKRAKAEADRAVGEARHKAEDEERRAGEQRERMAVQGERMPIMLERMMKHMEAMQRAVQQNPLFQAIGGEGFKMGDLPKIADELERMMKLEPNEKLVELLKHLEQMPEGQERKRAFEMLPAGAELDRPGRIEKLISELDKAHERLMQPETFEKLVQSAENTMRRIQEASTAAAEVGKGFVDALDKAAASLKPLVEGIGKIGDGLGFVVDKAGAFVSKLEEAYNWLTKSDNKLGDIKDKLSKMGGAGPSWEMSPHEREIRERHQGGPGAGQGVLDFLKSLFGVTPAGAAELSPELRGKAGAAFADRFGQWPGGAAAPAPGGGAGRYDASGKPPGLPPGAKFWGISENEGMIYELPDGTLVDEKGRPSGDQGGARPGGAKPGGAAPGGAPSHGGGGSYGSPGKFWGIDETYGMVYELPDGTLVDKAGKPLPDQGGAVPSGGGGAAGGGKGTGTGTGAGTGTGTNINADMVTITANNVSVNGGGGRGGGASASGGDDGGGRGGGASAPGGDGGGGGKPGFGGQGTWTTDPATGVSVYRPPSASALWQAKGYLTGPGSLYSRVRGAMANVTGMSHDERAKVIEQLRAIAQAAANATPMRSIHGGHLVPGTTLASDPIPGAVPATPGTGVRQEPYTFKQLREFQRAYAEWELRPVGPAPVIEDFYQHGGMISGPGSSTSDSILARLSNGEYVVKASAVSRLGVGFMHAINDFADGGLVLNLPRFAGGGAAVDAGPAAALHPLHLHMPNGKEIVGLFASRSAGEELRREATLAQASSTMGAKPSWFR